MKIATEQLPQQLQRGVAPLYTVYGAEPLLALEAIDRIRARARTEGYSEREILTTDQHFDWSLLALSAREQSLFASRRIVELRVPTGRPGNEGGRALQDFCARLPADTVVLVCLPDIDWKAQKAAWFRALETAGVMVEAKSVPRSALPAWLKGRLKAQAQHGDAATLDFIADRVEGNLLAAYQEVQKLALLFPAGELQFEQVKDAVLDVARYDIFDLGEIVLAGDAARLVRVLDGLRGEGAAPPLVLWAMAEEIRNVGRVMTMLEAGFPMPQALREARIWNAPRQTLIQRHLKRFSLPRIEAALMHAASIDRLIKGLGRGDAWDELLRLGLRFTQP